MRLCDEYQERMGLDPLVLRHSSKSFLFFEGGEKLLSIKWVGLPNSSGIYEFFESGLGKTIKIHRKFDVEWSSYESRLSSWLSENSGFVFEERKVFGLVWNFFVLSNERLLSESHDPFLVFSSMDPCGSPDLAKKILARVLARDARASRFWEQKPRMILEKYAYWLRAWR